MYFYMSLCNIPILTPLKPRHGFASNFVIFLGWTTTTFVEIRMLTLFKMELLVNLKKLKKIFVKNWIVTTTVPLGTFIVFRPPVSHVKT